MVTTASNANVSVPPFTSGTTAAVIVTGTKVNQTVGAQIGLRVTDRAGNVVDCDPTDLTIGRGQPVVQTVSGVPATEHLFTVFKGMPGLRILVVTTNGHAFVRRLADGQTATIDLANALHAGSPNTAKVIGIGGRGAKATGILHD